MLIFLYVSVISVHKMQILAKFCKICTAIVVETKQKVDGLLRAPSPFNYNFAQSNPHIQSIQYQIHSMSYYLFAICQNSLEHP